MKSLLVEQGNAIVFCLLPANHSCKVNVSLQAMEKDKEMSFLPRFQVYRMFKQQLEMRLVLRKTLQEKPEILEVIVFAFSLLCHKYCKSHKQIN